MIKNNNKAAVKKLAYRSMKKNRVRNRIVIIAAALTTMMFTVVFTVGSSLAENLKISMLRQQGTKAAISLNQPSEEQVQQIKKCKNLNAAGIEIPADTINIKNGKSEKKIYLEFCDTTEFNENILPATGGMKGKYPQEENEILLSEYTLESLGISDTEIGSEIEIISEGSKTRKFILSGTFVDFGFRNNIFYGYVSEKYVHSLGKTAENDGVLEISSKSGRQAALIEEIESSITLKPYQELYSNEYSEKESKSTSLIIAAIIAFISLIIISSGYLLIYNVMYISVTKDIKFYGLLKTIGTSPKQLRKIVNTQALRLALFGIPAGIITGTLISFAAVPVAIRFFSEESYGIVPTDINFNPLIYAGSVVFALLTIFISCRKPARYAGKISPVEALKYTGIRSGKKKNSAGCGGGRLYKMAFRNIFREKKRAVLVFTSLFLGSASFLAVNTFTGSLNLNNYINTYIPHDFVIYTAVYDDDDYEKTDQQKITAANELYEEINSLDEITYSSAMYSIENNYLEFDAETFRPYIEDFADANKDSEFSESADEIIDFYKENPESYSGRVVCADMNTIKEYNKTTEKKIDEKRFENGEICFAGYSYSKEAAEKMTGRKIKIVNKDNNKSAEVEIGTFVSRKDTDSDFNIGYYFSSGGAPECIIVSKKIYDKLADTPVINSMTFDCSPEYEHSLSIQIKNLIDGNSSVPSDSHVQIKSEMITDFKTSISALNIIVGGISAILILIGIINFINVMMTGVYARRKEFAVMESIGMTKKQTMKMLIYEGIYYGAIMTVIIFTLGTAIEAAIGKMTEKIADYAVSSLPVAEMTLLCIVITLICASVPVIVYKSTVKTSVTERIKFEE